MPFGGSKRAIGRNDGIGYTSNKRENQGRNKKVFRQKQKAYKTISLKSFLSLMIPLRYGNVNGQTEKIIRIYMIIKHNVLQKLKNY